MKKRYKLFNELIANWLVSIGITILVIMIFISVYPNEQEFTITEEVCEEEYYKSNWYRLDARDSISSWDINLKRDSDIKYYLIEPTSFHSREYLENKICFEIFTEQGIYPDKMVSSQGNLNVEIPFHIKDIYQEQFLVSNFKCKGVLYEEYPNYRYEKYIEVEINNILVKITPFNYSKITVKEFVGEYILINENDYWDAEFRIMPPEPEIVCRNIKLTSLKVKAGEVLPSTMIPEEFKEELGFEKITCGTGTTCPVYIEDITIKWLNENADKCYSESFGTWEKIIKGYPYDEGFCSKYKIGDYTIELK